MTSVSQGRAAETIACGFLQKAGLRLLERNYRCRRGEIDIIMRHKDSIVFVEVRYRRRPEYGSAAESIDAEKQRKIARCAARYLQNHPRCRNHPVRFDVVCLASGTDGPRIEWIRDAFRA